MCVCVRGEHVCVCIAHNVEGGKHGRARGPIPGSGRSPGEGNRNPLQYSCLENPMNGGAWWATVHGVAEPDVTEPLHFLSLS